MSDTPRSVSGLTSMPVNGSWASFAPAGAVPAEPVLPPVPVLAAVNGNVQEADVCTVALRPTTFRQGDGPIRASAWTTPSKQAGRATVRAEPEVGSVARPVPTNLPVVGSLTNSIH